MLETHWKRLESYQKRYEDAGKLSFSIPAGRITPKTAWKPSPTGWQSPAAAA